MESTTTEKKPTADFGKTMSESQAPRETSSRTTGSFTVLDFSLRFLLFASTLTAVVVMVTSKQTEFIPIPLLPVPARVAKAAKFNHSPAFM
uniref:CASP-like protein n=1 Tax=Nelumbo nucifera TaxID=4432 RepID=A0A822YPD3_NELNU|nr:TPA_asm: hypothetical protein HUJ06_012282 [Nelumbo nucifera]